MKLTRSAALSRHSAPAFVMLAGLELLKLRQLGWLARALFVELLAMADHATGAGRSSWAVLSALLDFDRTPGAHAAPGATTKRLRTAMQELQDAGLVRLDRVKNEKTQALIFRVQGRAGIAAADANSGRVRGRAQKPQTQATARVKRPPRAEEGQGEGQRVQEPKTYPHTPDLCTGTRPPPAIGELLKRITPRGGRTGAPKGA